jgi:hypothetical protein
MDASEDPVSVEPAFTIVGPADTTPPLNTQPDRCPLGAHHAKDVTCTSCGESFPWGVKNDGTARVKPGRKTDEVYLPGDQAPKPRAPARGGRGVSARSQASAEDLAERAADVLMQYQNWVRVGIKFLDLTLTIEAMDEARDELRQRTMEALVLDPELSRLILRGGAKSGKSALALAFLSYVGSVAPVAYVEIRLRREAGDE